MLRQRSLQKGRNLLAGIKTLGPPQVGHFTMVGDWLSVLMVQVYHSWKKRVADPESN